MRKLMEKRKKKHNSWLKTLALMLVMVFCSCFFTGCFSTGGGGGGSSSGGSSGGSAAAVASGQAMFALGTETGGSVRLPASYCGVYGLKTTYGVLSRWGVVAFGSSLDQVGLFGKTPSDIALPLSVMSGVDFYDDTSVDFPAKEELKAENIMLSDLTLFYKATVIKSMTLA